jgi:hypothetical protein
MSCVLLACLLISADTQPPDAVVIAPREFLLALAPLVEYRERQGHRLAIVDSSGSAEALRAQVQRFAGSLRYVLLVGDVPAALHARGVPTHIVPAKVNVAYGSEPHIASDNRYADIDGDDVPDVAVGRITADTPAELARIVAKILAYEQSTDFGPWRQRVNIVAGVGGFNPIVDTVIETATTRLLTSGIPAAYDTRMTYGSWRSPFCPDPRLFHAMTVERHNEGCLFWVYVGHGQARELDRVAIPGERFHILSVEDCRKLHCKSGAPIALMLACYTAAFDQPQDCLAEELLKANGGPVAVYGGSRVTMPYAMGVMGTSLMEEYFGRSHATLGDTILAAKRRMMMPIDDPEKPAGINRILLEGVAAVMSPNKEHLEQERREHLHLFNLLGDPMLRLAYPHEVKLAAPREIEPGQKLRIEGTSEIAGQAVLELICRRDCHKQPPPLRERFDPTDKALAAFQPVYERTLDRCWGRWSLNLPAGAFATEVEVPASSVGPCHLRLAVANHESHALGATNLYVRPLAVQNAAAGHVGSGGRR